MKNHFGKMYNFIFSSLEIISVIAFVPVLIASFTYGKHAAGFFFGLGIAMITVVVFGILFLTIENHRTLKAICDALASKGKK
ncbi:MAG: hypothetical protein WDN72_11270 [Alphaproteobacteria bacterium]